MTDTKRDSSSGFAPYAVPEVMDTSCKFRMLNGEQVDTPATRTAMKLAADIYKHANAAGIAPLVFAQEITKAVNETLALRAARSETTLRWRPHTELPTETDPVSCVLAFHDRDSEAPNEAALAGLYLWRGRQFVDEIEGIRAKPPFFWIYEREITASVPLPEAPK